MCRDGAFREDLLYRLNAMTITIPPLRERREEITPLIGRFMHMANEANGLRRPAGRAPRPWSCSPATRGPGNIRELRNAVSRAVVIADGETITTDDLPDRIRAARPTALPPEPEPEREEYDPEPPAVNLKAEVARFEAEVLTRALDDAGWDRNAAAQEPGDPGADPLPQDADPRPAQGELIP